MGAVTTATMGVLSGVLADFFTLANLYDLAFQVALGALANAAFGALPGLLGAAGARVSRLHCSYLLHFRVDIKLHRSLRHVIWRVLSFCS